MRSGPDESGRPPRTGTGAAPARLFPGFQAASLQTSTTTIHLVHRGSGPPLLLLHGYPQTHVMWHKIAPRLAQDFHVVAADLRGYGLSGKPPGGAHHEAYSKRAMAEDQVEVMRQLGFDRFAVAGHDRGGRVAHRMALDHPDRVTRLAVLDIVPTRAVYGSVTRELATAYWHWFFLVQPAPLPETLLGRDPDGFVDLFVSRIGGGAAAGTFTAEALDAYRNAFRDPATVHATCEDYRAAASIDLVHDEIDLERRIACPLLALWGERGAMHRLYDVLGTWRERALDVTGKALPSGHFLPEEAPDETFAALSRFFGDHGPD